MLVPLLVFAILVSKTQRTPKAEGEAPGLAGLT